MAALRVDISFRYLKQFFLVVIYINREIILPSPVAIYMYMSRKTSQIGVMKNITLNDTV
jgi:hypothetical protein